MIISFIKIFLSNHKVFTHKDLFNPNFSQLYSLIKYKIHMFTELLFSDTKLYLFKFSVTGWLSLHVNCYLTDVLVNVVVLKRVL